MPGARLTGRVQDIKYHAFFIEGAAHILALDLLQRGDAGRENLPWIQLAFRTIELLRPKHETPTNPSRIHRAVVGLAENLEHVVKSVYPDFRATPSEAPAPAERSIVVGTQAVELGDDPALQLDYPDPSFIPFELDVLDPAMLPSAALFPEGMDQPPDLEPENGEWNFDSMEAWLSIDENTIFTIGG